MISVWTCCAASLVIAMAGSVQGHAQGPSLDDVLTRVRANVAEYRASLPNLSCDESIDSKRLGDGNVKDAMTIESSFRITRGATGDRLQEARIKNVVDGKPAKNQKVNPPYSFNGGIANVLGFAAGECVEYRLGEPTTTEQGKIVLLISPKPVNAEQPACTGRGSQRRAIVDPVTYQVLRLEAKEEDVNLGWEAHVPFVPLPSGHNFLLFTVDYMPVTLGEKTFWLPRKVTSDIRDKSKPIELSYEAVYSNYRRYTATVTLGASQETAP